MNQFLIIAGIIGILLFLRWIRKQPRNRQIQGILALAAIVLIGLAITGRLHPLFAIIGTAVASFQKFAGLLRFVPLFRNLFRNTPTNNSANSDQTNRARQVTQMTREEAHQVLGIDENATKDEIIEAHRKLIQKIHPDRGGNNYLAAKINQAKDYLLKKTA